MPLSNWNRVRGKRLGVMCHYDGSTSDKGAVQWLTKDPVCKVSYTDIVLDDGKIVNVAPRSARAWHAGDCKPSRSDLKYTDANSAFYGLAIAAGGADTATTAQMEGVAKCCVEYFELEGWTHKDTWRITDHEAEAWPRGRKIDVKGDMKKRSKPVLDMDWVRRRVEELLRSK